MASIDDHSQAVPPIQAPECQHTVNLEELIREEMRSLPPVTKPCIYRIPQQLRDVNPKAYMPFRVAIGPYHANAEHLRSREPYKLRYLDSLMLRTRERQSNLRCCIKAIEDRETEAWKCYSGIEELDSQNFKRMLLLDGAFIVEFLCSLFDDRNMECPIQGNEKTGIEVCQDLLVLENQPPFFILENLFDCTFKNPPITFPEIAYVTLGSRIPFILSTEDCFPSERVKQRTTQGKTNHLLHLLRMCCLDVATTPSSLDVQGESSSHTAQTPRGSLEQRKLRFLSFHSKLQSWWGGKEEQHEVLEPEKVTPNHFRNPASVTELHEAGVQFRAKKGQFMHIEFDEGIGVLEMSGLVLSDYTEIFFRNVIAYEQYYLDEFDFTSYLIFMAELINTRKDVEILEESQLINNLVESKEDAANTFNSITKNIIYKMPVEHKELCHKLKAYTMKPWNRWNVMLRRDYFGSPWAIISVIAAVLLLGLTVVQTIATVCSTKWH